MSEIAHRLDGAAQQVRHVLRDPRTASDVLALAAAIDKVIAYLRDEPVTYASVTPLPTRIIPGPRDLPGETLGEFWNRTGAAAGGATVVPLTEEDPS